MYTKSILAFVLILLVLAALVIGGLFHWRGRTFRECEREFDRQITILEEVVTETLSDYDKCRRASNPRQAMQELIRENTYEGLLLCLEDDYKKIEQLTNRMAYLSLPHERTRVLECHKRLILLDRGIYACTFPDIFDNLTLWSPGEDGFFMALTEIGQRRKKEADLN